MLTIFFDSKTIFKLSSEPAHHVHTFNQIYFNVKQVWSGSELNLPNRRRINSFSISEVPYLSSWARRLRNIDNDRSWLSRLPGPFLKPMPNAAFRNQRIRNQVPRRRGGKADHDMGIRDVSNAHFGCNRH